MSHSMRDVNNLQTRTAVIELLVTTNLPYREVAEKTGVTWHTARFIDLHFVSAEVREKRKKAAYSRSKLDDNNPMKNKVGSLHHNYGKRWGKDSKYPTELKPTWFEGRVNSPRAYSAHIGWCKLLGISSIPEGVSVHHIDGDPENNEQSNLALVTDQAHRKIHTRERRLRENNRN